MDGQSRERGFVTTLSDKTLERLTAWPSPSGAGERLGMSRQGVLKRLNAGTLRGVLTSNGWLVDPDAIETLRKERGRG